MLTLRGHHLLCILTFVGKGYTAEFVQNLEKVVAGINAGEPVRLVWGPDSICAGWLEHPNCHCHRKYHFLWRDLAGFWASSFVLGRILWPGRELVLGKAEVARLRKAFKLGVSREACVGCQWFGLCSSVAKDGFVAGKLRP